MTSWKDSCTNCSEEAVMLFVSLAVIVHAMSWKGCADEMGRCKAG